MNGWTVLTRIEMALLIAACLSRLYYRGGEQHRVRDAALFVVALTISTGYLWTHHMRWATVFSVFAIALWGGILLETVRDRRARDHRGAMR